jgi:hypothetical protein
MLLQEQGHDNQQQQQQQQRMASWVGWLMPSKQPQAQHQQEPQSGTMYEDVSIGKSRRPSAELRELQRQIQQELQENPMLPQPAALQWCQQAPQCNGHQHEQQAEEQLQQAQQVVLSVAPGGEHRHGAEMHIEVVGVDDPPVPDIKAASARPPGPGCCVIM